MGALDVIIPCLNEEKSLEELLPFLLSEPGLNEEQIIVVDGNSTDKSYQVANKYGVRIQHCKQANRARQMNIGAAWSAADILYFLHADCTPPRGFYSIINNAVKKGAQAGAFRLKMKSKNPFLRINNWFTSLPYLWCRGGDQSFYMTRKCWSQIGPYPEVDIMEEYILWQRIFKQNIPFHLLPQPISADARKYAKNSYLKVQWANFLAFRMFKKGKSMDHIAQFYKNYLLI